MSRTEENEANMQCVEQVFAVSYPVCEEKRGFKKLIYLPKLKVQLTMLVNTVKIEEGDVLTLPYED